MKRQLGICLFVGLVWVGSANGQSGLFRLEPATISIGASAGFAEGSRSLALGLSYGMQSDVKGFLSGGAIFQDSNSVLDAFGLEVQPAPIFAGGIIITKPLGQSELEYIVQGSVLARFSRITQRGRTVASGNATTTAGSFGLLKRIPLQSGNIAVPFAAIHLNRATVEVESDLADLDSKETDWVYNGEAGLELGISPELSIYGSANYFFESSRAAFTIAAIYRPGVARKAEAQK